MRNRGFEVVSEYKDKGINIPVRKTRGSAAYDIEAAEDIVIPPYQQGIKPTLIPTGLKAYCRSDEFYILANRSSGPKKGFVMANSIGIIDSDYYNSDNEGHMFVKLTNDSNEDKTLSLKAGQGMVQGIFFEFGIVEDDDVTEERNGGFGSTTK